MLNLRIPVNSPTVVIPEAAVPVVVVRSGIEFQHAVLRLDGLFSDPDDDLLHAHLKHLGGAEGAAENEPTHLPSFVTVDPLWTSQGVRLSEHRGLELVLDQAAVIPPQTLDLAIAVSDGTSEAEIPFQVHFVQDCEVSEFKAWDRCSARCGGGRQARHRSVVADARGARAQQCPKLEESRLCNTEACNAMDTVQVELAISGMDLPAAQAAKLDEQLVDTIANMSGHPADLIHAALSRIEAPAGSSRAMDGDGQAEPSAAPPASLRAEITISVPTASGIGARALAEIVSQPGAWQTGVGSTQRISRHARSLASAVAAPLIFEVRATTVTSQATTATNEQPRARSRVVIIEARGQDVVIPVDGTDGDGDTLTSYLFQAPPASVGSVHQLSQVFSSHGYLPAAGTALVGVSLTKAVAVTGSLNRIVFRASAASREPSGQYGFLGHAVSDGSVNSPPGLTWLLPPHRRLVISRFFLGAEGWTVNDNSRRQAALPGGGIVHESYADGALDRYVLGVEAAVNPDADGQDRNQWYFEAPAAFQGNYAGAYAGELRFSMGVFEGTFDAEADIAVTKPLVELTCQSCGGRSGVTLGHFSTATAIQALSSSPSQYAIRLLAGSWRKKPEATNELWGAATECDLVAVLSGLTSLRVRGDLTTGHEAVGIDDVALIAPDTSASGLSGPEALVVRRTARDGLPLDCQFALTGDISSGGTNALSFVVAAS